jgi:GxxExxY protein
MEVIGEMTYKYNDNTDIIIQCIIKVHKELGPGFLESIYRNSLLIEISSVGLKIEKEKEVKILYKGHDVGIHRIDILVENTIIIELKTVESLSKAHYSQVRSYLKATGLNLGILVNFSKEKADFRRIEMN